MSNDITDQFYQVDEKRRQFVRDDNKLNYKNKYNINMFIILDQNLSKKSIFQLLQQ